MSQALDAIFVAVDGGPRDTLRPLANRCGATLEAVSEHDDETHWADVIARRSPACLVTGTSDSARGRRIEAAARRAAHAASLPIVAIEDFPGNYTPVSEGDADFVVVESEAAREIYAHRIGANAAQVLVASPARYDACRRDLVGLRHATMLRRPERGRRPTVLWAGQPDTGDALATLTALAPALRRQRIEVLFKAHPRDPGYESGAYAPLFDNLAVMYTDVTGLAIHDALSAAPDLVITQFSSVAIEAGFYGIPSVCVLLPDAGGARLEEKKGYSVPPFCAAGAAGLCTDAAEIDRILSLLITDRVARAELLRAFDAYFQVHAPAAPALLERLGELIPKNP